jgi:hypothetical protein
LFLLNLLEQDDTKEMKLYANMRSRKKTVDDVIQVLGGLKDEIRRCEANNAGLETRLNSITSDFKSRFDVLVKALYPMSGQSPGSLKRGKTMSGGSRGRSNSIGHPGRDRLNSSESYLLPDHPAHGLFGLERTNTSGSDHSMGSSRPGSRPQSGQRVRPSSAKRL